MRVENSSRHTIIVEQTEVANSVWMQTKGLMFKRHIPINSGLLMVFREEKHHGIWTMGMRFPIDIAFISSDWRVVDIVENARPIGINPKTWKIYTPEKPCKYVLEMNAGILKKSGTKKGDVISFKPTNSSDIKKFKPNF